MITITLIALLVSIGWLQRKLYHTQRRMERLEMHMHDQLIEAARTVVDYQKRLTYLESQKHDNTDVV